MSETLANQLARLCCAETEGKFFDCVTDNIGTIIAALRSHDALVNGRIRQVTMRHYARRAVTGEIEVVDRRFDFVRAVLPYDYKYTCNAQQWDEALRICRALEGPMISQGVVSVVGDVPQP